MPKLVTLEELKASAPLALRPLVQQELVDSLNAVQGEEGRIVRENLLTYAEVLSEGRFKVMDYMSAVKFVSYRMMGCSQIDAYIKTFPDRYNRMLQQGKTMQDIYPFASIYNKNKLVTKIVERTLIPPKILYQDIYHKSIHTLVDMMQNAATDKVKVMAATELMKELSPKEEVGARLQIDVKQDSSIDDLKKAFSELAIKQKDMIEKGMPVKTIAEQGIVDVEAEEVA